MSDMHPQAQGLKPLPGGAHAPCAAVPGLDSPSLTHCYELMLDEIDYGVLLLDGDAQVLHLNHAARCELDAQHPLQLLGRQLRARDAADTPRLTEALQAAALRGLRRLLGSDPAASFAGSAYQRSVRATGEALRALVDRSEQERARWVAPPRKVEENR